MLLTLRNGISEINIYKNGLYPSTVSFVLGNKQIVTIRAKEEYVAHWFEVFPIAISEQVISVAPTTLILPLFQASGTIS